MDDPGNATTSDDHNKQESGGLHLHPTVILPGEVTSSASMSLTRCVLPECCNNKVHCPFCDVRQYKPAQPSRVKDHLHLTHFQHAVYYDGTMIVKCFHACRGSETKGGHYHCPVCSTTLLKRNGFTAHLLAHVQKEGLDRRMVHAPDAKKPDLIFYDGYQIKLCHEKSCGDQTEPHFHCPMCRRLCPQLSVLTAHMWRCKKNSVALATKVNSVGYSLDVPKLFSPEMISDIPHLKDVEEYKWHLSIIRNLSDLALVRCESENCCKGRYHCPLCTTAKLKPNHLSHMKQHLVSHWRTGVQFRAYTVLVCYLPCEVTQQGADKIRFHYHCPLCGATRRRRQGFARHLEICDPTNPRGHGVIEEEEMEEGEENDGAMVPDDGNKFVPLSETDAWSSAPSLLNMMLSPETQRTNTARDELTAADTLVKMDQRIQKESLFKIPEFLEMDQFPQKSHVKIPEPSQSLEDHEFQQKSHIKIPEPSQSLEDREFQQKSHVKIPEPSQSLEDREFQQKSHVQIPEPSQSLEDREFQQKSHVQIPEPFQSLEDREFQQKSQVKIPELLESLEDHQLQQEFQVKITNPSQILENVGGIKSRNKIPDPSQSPEIVGEGTDQTSRIRISDHSDSLPKVEHRSQKEPQVKPTGLCESQENRDQGFEQDYQIKVHDSSKIPDPSKSPEHLRIQQESQHIKIAISSDSLENMNERLEQGVKIPDPSTSLEDSKFQEESQIKIPYPPESLDRMEERIQQDFLIKFANSFAPLENKNDKLENKSDIKTLNPSQCMEATGDRIQRGREIGILNDDEKVGDFDSRETTRDSENDGSAKKTTEKVQIFQQAIMTVADSIVEELRQRGMLEESLNLIGRLCKATWQDCDGAVTMTCDLDDLCQAQNCLTRILKDGIDSLQDSPLLNTSSSSSSKCETLSSPSLSSSKSSSISQTLPSSLSSSTSTATTTSLSVSSSLTLSSSSMHTADSSPLKSSENIPSSSTPSNTETSTPSSNTKSLASSSSSSSSSSSLIHNSSSLSPLPVANTVASSSTVRTSSSPSSITNTTSSLPSSISSSSSSSIHASSAPSSITNTSSSIPSSSSSSSSTNPKRKRGRPKGSKNKATIQREAKQQQEIVAKKHRPSSNESDPTAKTEDQLSTILNDVLSVHDYTKLQTADSELTHARRTRGIKINFIQLESGRSPPREEQDSSEDSVKRGRGRPRKMFPCGLPSENVVSRPASWDCEPLPEKSVDNTQPEMSVENLVDSRSLGMSVENSVDSTSKSLGISNENAVNSRPSGVSVNSSAASTLSEVSQKDLNDGNVIVVSNSAGSQAVRVLPGKTPPQQVKIQPITPTTSDAVNSNASTFGTENDIVRKDSGGLIGKNGKDSGDIIKNGGKDSRVLIGNDGKELLWLPCSSDELKTISQVSAPKVPVIISTPKSPPRHLSAPQNLPRQACNKLLGNCDAHQSSNPLNSNKNLEQNCNPREESEPRQGQNLKEKYNPRDNDLPRSPSPTSRSKKRRFTEIGDYVIIPNIHFDFSNETGDSVDPVNDGKTQEDVTVYVQSLPGMAGQDGAGETYSENSLLQGQCAVTRSTEKVSKIGQTVSGMSRNVEKDPENGKTFSTIIKNLEHDSDVRQTVSGITGPTMMIVVQNSSVSSSDKLKQTCGEEIGNRNEHNQHQQEKDSKRTKDIENQERDCNEDLECENVDVNAARDYNQLEIGETEQDNQAQIKTREESEGATTEHQDQITEKKMKNNTGQDNSVNTIAKTATRQYLQDNATPQTDSAKLLQNNTTSQKQTELKQEIQNNTHSQKQTDFKQQTQNNTNSQTQNESRKLLQNNSNQDRPTKSNELLENCTTLQMEPKRLRRCPICRQTCETYTSLSHHVHSQHPTSSPMMCDVCELVFPTTAALWVHVDYRHGPKPEHMQSHGFACETCGKQCLSASSLRSHRSLVHKEKINRTKGAQNLICAICKYQATDSWDKRHHREQHRFQTPICSVCGKRLSSDAALKVHMAAKHSTTSHSCEICGKTFAHIRYLRSHLQRHRGEKRHACPECGWRFYQTNTLKAHMDTHKPRSQRTYAYKCPHCPAAYNNQANYKDHLNKHTGERPHVCAVCSRGFAFRSMLTSHMRFVHSFHRPYICSQCDKSYKTKTQLNHHEMTHSMAQTGNSPFMCGKCNRPMASRGRLNAHVKHCKGSNYILQQQTVLPGQAINVVQGQPVSFLNLLPGQRINIVSHAFDKNATVSMIPVEADAPPNTTVLVSSVNNEQQNLNAHTLNQTDNTNVVSVHENGVPLMEISDQNVPGIVSEGNNSVQFHEVVETSADNSVSLVSGVSDSQTVFVQNGETLTLLSNLSQLQTSTEECVNVNQSQVLWQDMNQSEMALQTAAPSHQLVLTNGQGQTQTLLIPAELMKKEIVVIESKDGHQNILDLSNIQIIQSEDRVNQSNVEIMDGNIISMERGTIDE